MFLSMFSIDKLPSPPASASRYTSNRSFASGAVPVAALYFYDSDESVDSMYMDTIYVHQQMYVRGRRPRRAPILHNAFLLLDQRRPGGPEPPVMYEHTRLNNDNLQPKS